MLSITVCSAASSCGTPDVCWRQLCSCCNCLQCHLHIDPCYRHWDSYPHSLSHLVVTTQSQIGSRTITKPDVEVKDLLAEALEGSPSPSMSWSHASPHLSQSILDCVGFRLSSHTSPTPSPSQSDCRGLLSNVQLSKASRVSPSDPVVAGPLSA